jgi:hypothetical protein
MSWIRTIVAVVIAFIVGVIPPELLSWLRQWATRDGRELEAGPEMPATGKRRRGSRRRARSN